jgi:6-pyruvoyl-tetrahydropterin synthase
MVIASTFDIDASHVVITAPARQIHVHPYVIGIAIAGTLELLITVVVIALTLVIAIVRRFAVGK